MPPDPLDAIRNWNEAEERYRTDLAITPEEFQRIADKLDAGEPGGYQALTPTQHAAVRDYRRLTRVELNAWRERHGSGHPSPLAPERDPDPELDEWRATYGRLDIPVTVIDWRPVYAGAAALGIALVARWMARR